MNKYINQFIDNFFRYLDLPAFDITIKNINLEDKYNQINFKTLSKCYQIMYIVDTAHKVRFAYLLKFL